MRPHLSLMSPSLARTAVAMRTMPLHHLLLLLLLLLHPLLHHLRLRALSVTGAGCPWMNSLMIVLPGAALLLPLLPVAPAPAPATRR